MASEEQQETIEEKKASNEAIDLQAIHNPITTESKKEQMNIKSGVLDENIVNKERDLIKEETEVPSKLGIFVEPNQIITEKPESLEKCSEKWEGELKEHEEAVSPLDKPIALEKQEKVNGETENELYSTHFTEQLSPELVLKGDAIPANVTSILSEEVQEKIETEEVMTENGPQNQNFKKDETETDVIQSNSMVTLSEKDSQKAVDELPIGNASQNLEEEDVADEVEIPSNTKPLFSEEILEVAKGENCALEDVQKEQIHQIEVNERELNTNSTYQFERKLSAKETMAEEKECSDETEDQNKDVSMVVASEETIPEEASQENQTPEIICEEVKQTEHMSEEVKENEVAATTSLISEEAEESADIKEDTKEEAHQNQILNEDEAGEDADQSTSVVYIPEKSCENETEKTIENASGNPEEEVTKEVESASSVTPPVSEEVLEEAKEKNDAVEEVQNEQAAKENWAEEKECPAEAEVQNRDVSEETMPEEASPEKETPEMISGEVEPSDDAIDMAEKDETRQNDNEENATDKDLTSSHQTIANEETSITDESSEHISEKSTLESVTTRDIAPEIEIKDAQTEALTSETEDRNIEKLENEEEEKSPEEVKPSESKDAPMEIEEETLYDFEEEKSEGDNKSKQKETDNEQEVKSCFTIEEQLDESKAPPSEEDISAERDTIETKLIKETERVEQNVAQNEIISDSKEAFSNDDEVVNYDGNTGQAMEIHIAEEHKANNGINGDELWEGNGKDDEADKGNIEEISEPAEAINNTEVSIDAEIPREDFEPQSENAVSAQLTEGEEAPQDTPCESTALSVMEKENEGYKAVDSETDSMVVENSREDDPNELPDKADKDASASEDQIEEDRKVEINEHEEVEQKLEVEEKTEENLFGNFEHETAPGIQNEENSSEKDDNIKNEIIDESDIEGSTKVTEVPEEDAQNRTSERSDKQDQLVPEKTTEQDGLKISSNDNEYETEKLIIGDSSSHEEERANVILQNDDELDLKLKPKEKIKAETLSNEEITQRVEEVDEPCITHDKEEEIPQITDPGEVPEVDLSQSETVVPETENLEVVSDEKFVDESKSADTDSKSVELEKTENELTELKECSIKSSNTREVQIDQLSLESDVKPTEPDRVTDEVSTQENSEVDATLSASEEQIGEGSVSQEESVILQQEDLVAEMPKEDAETEKLEIGEASSHEKEKSSVILRNDDELDLKHNPEEKIKAETLSNEEITQVIEPCITHNKEELSEEESTIECKEASNEPSISTIRQDQQSEETEAMPTEANQSADAPSVEEGSETNTTLISSTEQIDERSIAKEEGDKMQEEIIVAETPKEETEGESTEKQIEEIPQITNPIEVPEVDLSQSDTTAPETENLEVVSDEKFGDESKSADTDSKSVELESGANELLTDLKESSIETSNTRESDVKPTEPDRATDEVSAQENSEVDATLSASEEQIGEESVAQEEEESAILQEEDLKMSKEDTEMIAAENGKHIEEEIPQIVHPSEITEEQLVESETVGSEAEHLEIVSNEKFGDESKLTENDLKSAQVESTPDELIEEKRNANLSSSERSVESEVLLQNTGEGVQGEKTDVEMPKGEICQAIDAAEEPCDKHIEGEILKTADSEIYNAAEEKEVDPQNFETQTESLAQEKATEESTSVEEKSDATAILVPSEGHMEEKENAINESSVVPRSTNELVIETEEKISQGVETNEEPSDMVIAGEIPQIIPTSEITEKQLVESEIVGPDAEHLEIVSKEKFGDENKVRETDSTSGHIENMLDELIKEKSIVDLSASVEQISERSEESEGFLQNTDEQVQREKPDAEMPKEEIGQSIEAAEAPCDKHIEGEICKTRDLEIFDAAEESKAILTEKEVDPQKFGTQTESPELEKATKESASVEEKSDATAIIVPGEGQIEEIEIANKESSGVPQSTNESEIVSEENSQGIETNDKPSDKYISVQSSEISNPEIHDVVVHSTIVSNDEEVDSEKLGTQIESTELEKATEESTSVEEKSDAGADLVPSEGQLEEKEFANKESSVAPQSTVELVTVPEEIVSQGIETNEELSDKHIVGEIHEKDISIDNFEASEEINLVLEDKVDQGQTTASPVEQPDSKNFRTEMESAFLEKTNGDIDVKVNLEKTTVTSFVEDEGAVINQTDNGSETVPVVEQTHEEEAKLIDEKIVPAETANHTETKELQVQEEVLDTVVTEPENQTKDEDLIRTETKEEFSETVRQEKDIPTEFLKTAEEKGVAVETNEDTEETVPNSSEQNKEVEEEAYQLQGPEDRDFASIVSSFLISKVLSEENPRTDDGAKQNNDASFIPKALDEETTSEITTGKKEPETADEEISHATSLREEEKPEIQEREEENVEKKAEEDGEGGGVEQDYLPVSRFLMDKILQQEENKNLGEEKAIEETDKQLIRDDGIQVEEKIKHNSNPVVEPEQKGETPSSFAVVARDFEKEETPIKKVDDTCVGDDGISIEEKTEETSSVVALPKQGEGSHSSIEIPRDFEEEKPADDAPKPVEDENKTVVNDVGILSVEKNEEVNRSVVVVPEQEGEKNISPIEVVRDFEKEDKIIEQKNEELVTNEGISIIEKIEDTSGEETRDFDKDVKPVETKDESLVSIDGASTPNKIEENNKVALHDKEGETEPSVVKEVDDLANGEQNKDLEEVLVNPREFFKPEKIIDENKSVVKHEEEEQTTELIADEEIPIDSKDVEENYVLVEREVDQFEESKEIPMPLSDATIPNPEKKQNNLSAEMQDVERNLVQQVEITEKGMKNSSASFKEIEESLPDIPKVLMAGVETEAILQEPLEKQTEIRKELVGNETYYTRGEEQVKEVTGTVVGRTQNKNQELTETEATKIEKKSEEEIKDEENKEEEKEEKGEEEEEEKHQDETEIIGRDLTVKAEARESTETKSVQKKSHNILSGVGSKVKHSIAKVKKAITGKSKNVSPSAK